MLEIVCTCIVYKNLYPNTHTHTHTPCAFVEGLHKEVTAAALLENLLYRGLHLCVYVSCVSVHTGMCVCVCVCVRAFVYGCSLRTNACVLVRETMGLRTKCTPTHTPTHPHTRSQSSPTGRSSGRLRVEVLNPKHRRTYTHTNTHTHTHKPTHPHTHTSTPTHTHTHQEPVFVHGEILRPTPCGSARE